MALSSIAADNTVFVVLSFEGPDPYSLAGGLGVRITNLSQTLAETGFPTHFFFIGDPKAKGEEARHEGKLILHRWCQWISEYYPNGVYQGENEKVNDFNGSIPAFVTENIIKKNVEQDKLVVILAEEWHTAEAVCRLNEYLRREGLRDRTVLFWNANNTFGFDRIDWRKLTDSATITTVSRYMKRIMWEKGVNPLVIPNGIPKAMLRKIDEEASDYLRRKLDADFVSTKVARWDPDKRWNTAIESIAGLKAKGRKVILLARGGIEPYGEEVMQTARSLGLKVTDVKTDGCSLSDYVQAIGNDGGDIINVRFHCPPEFLRILYHASDAVLANSGHEPFGLVGLETMAAGGIAFTGGTGEDYAIHFHNAIVLETADPKEIEAYVTYLDNHADRKEKIRKVGRQTARRFTWEEITSNLLEKLENRACIQEILDIPAGNNHSHEPEAEEFPEISRQAVLAETR